MKKCITLIISVLLVLTGCTSNHIRNLDTFCYRFNTVSDSIKIDRNIFITEEKDGVLFSYYLTDKNILIEIIHDNNSMNIKRLNITAENLSDIYLNIAVSSVIALSDIDKNTTENLLNELFTNKEKEYANEMHTLEYITLFYTKTASGHSFSVTYNEEIPTETTTVPETATEYTFEAVTS